MARPPQWGSGPPAGGPAAGPTVTRGAERRPVPEVLGHTGEPPAPGPRSGPVPPDHQPQVHGPGAVRHGAGGPRDEGADGADGHPGPHTRQGRQGAAHVTHRRGPGGATAAEATVGGSSPGREWRRGEFETPNPRLAKAIFGWFGAVGCD